jgi:hypothetical protein
MQAQIVDDSGINVEWLLLAELSPTTTGSDRPTAVITAKATEMAAPEVQRPFAVARRPQVIRLCGRLIRLANPLQVLTIATVALLAQRSASRRGVIRMIA